MFEQEVAFPFWVTSTGQVELFNHFLFLKPFDYVQTSALARLIIVTYKLITKKSYV